MKYGAPFSDPATGLHAPIMGMTIHPQTGALLPVGGCHVDPVTRLPVAIEVGSMMVDPVSSQPVPILGVAIDPSTGEVVPIGGTRQGPNNTVALIQGDNYLEPLSNMPVKLGGAILSDADVMPSCGGQRALLDASVMACEARLLDSLRHYKEAVTGEQASENPHGLNARHEESQLETAIKQLEKARNRSKATQLKDVHDLQRREERSSVLALTGGSPGMCGHLSLHITSVYSLL